MALLGHVRRGAIRVASNAGCGERNREVDAVRRHDLDLRVHDRVALDEIELYAEMLSAVAAAKEPLTNAEIDMVLGLGPGDAGRRELTPQD